MPSIFTPFDMTITSSTPWIFNYWWALFPIMTLFRYYWTHVPSYPYVINYLHNACSDLILSTNSKHIKGMLLLASFIFFCLLLLNMYGMALYSISLTSHLMMTLSLAIPVWMSLILMSMIISWKMSGAHLLPPNTPPMIASFLLLVEALSSLIRPLTLAFRLAANISAGHVILGMASSGTTYLMFQFKSGSWAPIILDTMYTMFEFAVCSVQAFVFILLIAMYSNDYISTKE